LAEKSLPNVKSLKDKNKEIVSVIPLTPNGSWTIQSPRILVLSGSGISVASGMPTYRTDDGVWLETDIKTVCDINTWQKNKSAVQSFYQKLFDTRKSLQKNIGHITLDELPRAAHFTQNVDDFCLHSINLHGSIFKLHCTACGKKWKHKNVIDLSKPCPKCGETGQVKPGVVFFHENPPVYSMFLQTLRELTSDDVLLIVGTSGAVVPILQWCRQLSVPATKWLYNKEKSNALPEHLFDEVVFGPFEETCDILKAKWQKHIKSHAKKQKY